MLNAAENGCEKDKENEIERILAGKRSGGNKEDTTIN